MRAKFIKGITTGAMIGAAAGLMVAPNMKKSTRRKIIRGSRHFIDTAGEAYESIMHYMK